MHSCGVYICSGVCFIVVIASVWCVCRSSSQSHVRIDWVNISTVLSVGSRQRMPTSRMCRCDMQMQLAVTWT